MTVDQNRESKTSAQSLGMNRQMKTPWSTLATFSCTEATREGEGGGGGGGKFQTLPVYIFPPKGKVPESEAWSVGAVLEYHSSHIYPIQRERGGAGGQFREPRRRTATSRGWPSTRPPPHQRGGCYSLYSTVQSDTTILSLGSL